MAHIPLIAAFLTALASLSLPGMVYTFPRMGVWPARHLEKIRMILTIAALTLAAATFFMNYVVYDLFGLALVLFVLYRSWIIFPYTIFTALNQTKKIPAAKANLKDDTPVIGVAIGNEAIAWPIGQVLMPRLVLNDNVSGRKLLVIYCPISDHARVYSPVVDGRPLTFSVIGVHRNNLLIRDNETRTVWQQFTGEALSGHFKGQRLKPESCQRMTWGRWIKEHPGARLAIAPDDAPRPKAPRNTLIRYMHMAPTLPHRGLTPPDSRLKAHATVIGIETEAGVKAYPLTRLPQGTGIQDMIEGTTISLSYEPDDEFLTIQAGSVHVQHRRAHWLVWAEFFPGIPVYEAKNN